ncbi:2TM domain-containing protein [Moheibacter sediminis]|uniref:2TM domain-containing protein n=1 Tax=Moheibacter sediminis TaxID=1434700 RepID=A0A1W2BV99_9FLAO|nr:2TM domain-containing protein [Moheibacter sediminis]SMC76801.1 2TM domain-containing protein [Moheibacter sediminis]
MENNKNYSTEEYLAAKKAVEERLGFYVHLAAYILVNGYFVFLSVRSGGYFWAIWPMVGWGIGLAFHGIGVFGFFNNNSWKDKQIHKELEKRRKFNL